MDKYNFLKTLEYELGNLDAEVKADILADFSEHFDVAAESGKTEGEICRTLGDPREIAREFIADYADERSKRAPEADAVPRGAFDETRVNGRPATVEKTDVIKIELIDCELSIEGGDTDIIDVSYTGDHGGRFITENTNGIYWIREKPQKQFFDNFISRVFVSAGRNAIDMAVRVPRGFAGTIDAGTASGDVEAADLTHLRALVLKTASGDIEIKSVSVSEDVKLSTGSGDISAERATAGHKLYFNTGSGDVEINKCAAAVETVVSTGSGDIEARASSGTLSAATGSGEIDVNAHTGTVSGKTGSGDIDINTDEIAADLTYVTGSGDIDVKVKKLSADIKMTTGSGDVSLRVEDLNGNVAVKTSTGDIQAAFGHDSDAAFKLKTGFSGSKRNAFPDTGRGAGKYTVALETHMGDIEVKAI